MSQITLHDKTFELMIPKAEIKQSIKKMAKKIDEDFHGKELVVVGVLDGVFMVLADLLKRLHLNLSVELIKLKSYEGQQSTGSVRKLLGLTQSLEGKHVLVVEDIVDTGITLAYVLDLVRKHKPASISVATLLLKNDVFKDKFPIQYYGITIPNKFVVGYGMDYEGQGRQLTEIYSVID
ncbi:MAG: hypoxanthine phosphoribosyltransferase [Marinoscillum sp.]